LLQFRLVYFSLLFLNDDIHSKELINTVCYKCPENSVPQFIAMDLWLQRTTLNLLYKNAGISRFIQIFANGFEIRLELIRYLTKKFNCSDSELFQLTEAIKKYYDHEFDIAYFD
jgi:hypothetical protein